MGALMRARCIIGLALLALACAGPVRVESLPEARGRGISKVALLPIEATAADGNAANLITAKLLEALVEVGRFNVIPPTEVALALQSAGSPTQRKDVDRALATAFGCDAIMSGSVERFVNRIGGPRGVTRAASVAFGVEVESPDGTLLWRGRYDETQEDLAGNLFTIGRASERGFQWVTADALAAYGARELVSGLRQSADAWK